MTGNLLSAVLVLTAPGPLLNPVVLGPYEPARGCYIGAYIRLDPVVRGDIEAFERLVGKKHATYFRYVGYGQPFPFKWVKRLRDRGYAPHIAWEPNDGLDVVRDDDYLRGWAEAARHAAVPIFLRYASEMNGTWQAWSGDPELYKEKWRLVYRVIHEVAPNVVMIWCPFAMPRATIQQYYPGDEYVDWVGVNIYSVMRHDGDATKIGGEDPRDLLRYVYELYAAKKPIAVCEYGATHFCKATGQRCSNFAVDAMTKMYRSLAQEFPRVRMINWFSVDAAKSGLAHNDYALTTDELVLSTYRQLIADDYFLSSVAEKPVVAARPEKPAEKPPEPKKQEQPVKPPSGQPAEGIEWVESARSAGPVSQIHIAILGARPDQVHGRVSILVQLPRSLVGGMVTVYLDERVKGISNAPPFEFPLNADALEEGLHVLRVEVADTAGRVIAQARAGFVVRKAGNE